MAIAAFAGVVCPDGLPDETLARFSSAFAGLDRTPARTRSALFAWARRPAARRPSAPGTLFAASARIDNRDDGSDDDESYLFARLAKDDWAGLAELVGAFAFAHWSENDGTLTLGRDCLGNRALFFARERGRIVFSSSLPLLLALPGVPRRIDEVQLANYMVLNLYERRRTFYQGIERVPSRTVVTIKRDGIAECPYWAPTPRALDRAPEAALIEEARSLFAQAVRDATRDLGRVAIAASGGLDSSAIAATAVALGMRTSCYSGVLAPGGTAEVASHHYADERDKMEALARRYPALDVHYVTPQGLHAVDIDPAQVFARSAVPNFAALNFGWYSHLFDQVRADGHETALVGTTGNFGLSWPGGYSLLAHLRAGHLGRFTRDLRTIARATGAGVPRTFARDVVFRALPDSARRVMRRLRGRDPWDVARHSALNPAIIAELDLKRRWREAGFDPWLGHRGSDPVVYRTDVLFDFNQPARDFAASSHAILGVELRDPHGDRRLLEFALSVPETLYRKNGVERSFARAVFADRLPREILEEKRRGEQNAGWYETFSARRDDIPADIERLEASPLVRRMIDVPRLKAIAANWPATAAEAQARKLDVRIALGRAMHFAHFIRWVEGGNS